MSEAPARARPRQRSVYCSARERRLVRARAKAAGKTISRYVLDLVSADAPDGGEAHSPSAEERQALTERVRGIEEALHALRDPLPECGGLTLADAIALLAREHGR